MIVFLTLLYCGVLFLLFKLKVIKPTKVAKASPVLWMLILTVCLFIPMQFWAPAGSARMIQYSVAVVPAVSGQVLEVPVKPNVPLKKGDVLFRLDPVPYQAAVDQTEAQLKLARLRLAQSKELASADAGSRFEVEQFEAQVRQLEAALSAAQWNLEQTVVRAPADGFVTNVALRPGARVAALPLAPAMVFYDTSERMLFLQVPEGYLRHVEKDGVAEVTFKMFPGEVHVGKVLEILPATALGSVGPSGMAAAPQNIRPGAFHVKLALDEPEVLTRMPAGAVGTGAIYSAHGAPTHIIRKVMVRMDAWLNYVNPL